jgi:hypothetical protein
MNSYSDPVLSSANVLANELVISSGIQQSEIQSEHIESVYRDMPRIGDVADFSIVDDVLGSGLNDAVQKDSVCGVIVETRKHHALEKVVLNVVEMCNIPVQLFHGTGNLDYILSSAIVRLVETGQVRLTRLNTDKLDSKAYNALLLSPAFWQRVVGREKILIFQTDSLCCIESTYSLADFIGFDYIGGSWNRNRPVGLIIDGGNGGFSLRDWAVSLQCLSQFPPRLWGGGEDGYYAFHMALIGAAVASSEESAKFATQDTFSYHSFGAHKISSLSQDSQRKFFAYCSQAKEVFPNAYAQIA